MTCNSTELSFDCPSARSMTMLTTKDNDGMAMLTREDDHDIVKPSYVASDNETETEALTEAELEACFDLQVPPSEHTVLISQSTQGSDTTQSTQEESKQSAEASDTTQEVIRLPAAPKPTKDTTGSKPELDWTFLEDGQLFGRQEEIDALQEAFRRRTEQQSPELMLLSGKSGTGKTALVKGSLQAIAQECNGFFLMGKFDQLQSSEPYGPFVAALTQLAIFIEQTDDEKRRVLRHEILTDVGIEACHVVCALVPAFAWVLGLPEERLSLKTHDAQQDRLVNAMTKLFQVICTKERPIALVMDDLQWSDTGSLHLLEALASDNDLQGLLVVGICRCNEVPWHHDFAGMLRRLEDEKETTITHIQVNNLTVEATNALLSEMLKQGDPRLCLPLAEIIHDKSEGNVFFILYLLRTLYEGDILVAEKDSQTQELLWLWNDDKWDLSAFQKDNLNVVDLVSNHIRRLPVDCRRFLKVAASMGAEFDLEVLDKVLKDNAAPVPAMEMLAIALEENMVVVQSHRPGRFAFAHDRIQQAAYSLIPESDQPSTHLTIGKCLFQQLSPEELESNLFLVVNQLLRGMTLLTAEVDKIGLAALCLRAGRKAFEASNFEIALSYFRSGISLLPQRHWRDEYHLSLDLYNSKAEAECCVASFELMDETIEEILANCRSANDKSRSYLTKIYSLGVRADFETAISLGFEVLASLGEKFPSTPRIIYLIPELLKVQRQLKSKSDSDILNLPMIDDQHKLTAMSILKLLSVYVFCADPDVFPFLVVRWVRLTLKYGLSDVSCLAFASYGVLMCAVDEFGEGYRYARLGQQLLESCHLSQSHLPRLNFLLYGMVSPWKRPLRSTFEPMKLAISCAVDTGDLECYMFTSYNYILLSYAAGAKLCIVEDRINQYIKLMESQGGPWLAFTSVHQQLMENLMGKTEDPLKLNFGDMGSDLENKNDFTLFEHASNTTQLTLAYHFGDLDLALVSARKSRVASKATKTCFMMVFQYFYDAMTALEAARTCERFCLKRRQHLQWARSIVRRLETLAGVGPDNILHKLYLLRGEEKATGGKLRQALDWYQKAADHASNEGVTQMEALAYERSALAVNRLGKGDRDAEAQVVHLLSMAIERYQEWGAVSLVEHLKKIHNL